MAVSSPEVIDRSARVAGLPDLEQRRARLRRQRRRRELRGWLSLVAAGGLGVWMAVTAILSLVGSH